MGKELGRGHGLLEGKENLAGQKRIPWIESRV